MVELPPISVSVFALQGLTLLILPKPGGMVSEDLMAMLLDDTILDVLPGPVTVIIVALIVWVIIKNTHLGTNIFSVLSVMVLGQECAIMSGGFDLSIGWCVTTCGVVSAMFMNGSDLALLWARPITLAVGAAIGMINGFLISVIGLSPIVVTLAVGGLLQSFTMFISGGAPSGEASPLLHWFVNGKIASFAPLSLAIFLFVFFGVILLSCTPFYRRLIAVGSNARSAMLCGVNVRNVTLLCYVISGVCGAIAGVLLTGFLGRSSLTLDDNYLLPTVAAIAVGGTLITGGRGHYLGMFGGALALTALQILLSGTPLPPAVRDIILGFAVMIAVVSLREK